VLSGVRSASPTEISLPAQSSSGTPTELTALKDSLSATLLASSGRKDEGVSLRALQKREIFRYGRGTWGAGNQ